MKNTLNQINVVAESEGWSIVNTGLQDAVHNIFELQRLGDMLNFQNDKQAIRHVVKKAIESPDSIYADAIRFLAKESPNELDSMIQHTVGDVLYKPLIAKLKIML